MPCKTIRKLQQAQEQKHNSKSAHEPYQDRQNTKKNCYSSLRFKIQRTGLKSYMSVKIHWNKCMNCPLP